MKVSSLEFIAGQRLLADWRIHLINIENLHEIRALPIDPHLVAVRERDRPAIRRCNRLTVDRD